jgi:hypothetical protein
MLDAINLLLAHQKTGSAEGGKGKRVTKKMEAAHTRKLSKPACAAPIHLNLKP